MNDVLKETPWGRIDDTNTVFVKEATGERAIGQYPDGTAEEALAYFTRKYEDLEGQVRLAEQRIITGSAGTDVANTVAKLIEQLEAPAALGDLDSLRDRAAKLQEKASEFVQQQQELRAEQKQAALAERESIVAEAEQIAAQPESQIRWKESGEALEKLFNRWQNAQKTGPNIGKTQADELWKRFRAARNSFDAARRKYFAQVDATNKSVKQAKEALITAAEALDAANPDAINTYRGLLNDWKASGRASRKIDDQLWAKFKAAGDVLYQAKAESQAKIDEEYAANLIAKQAIIEKATAILDISDHDKARKALLPILEEWDSVGRVPRASVREIEDQIKKIERHVQKLEDDHWAATNPETIARSEGLRGQLESSIATLKEQVAEAEAKGDKARAKDLQQQLSAQESWLAAIK